MYAELLPTFRSPYAEGGADAEYSPYGDEEREHIEESGRDMQGPKEGECTKEPRERTVSTSELYEEQRDPGEYDQSEKRAFPLLQEAPPFLEEEGRTAEETHQCCRGEEHAVLLHPPRNAGGSKEKSSLRDVPERAGDEEERARSFREGIERDVTGEEAHEAVNGSEFACANEECGATTENGAYAQGAQPHERMLREEEIQRKEAERGKNSEEEHERIPCIERVGGEQCEAACPQSEQVRGIRPSSVEEDPEEESEERDRVEGEVSHDHVEEGETVCEDDERQGMCP